MSIKKEEANTGDTYPDDALYMVPKTLPYFSQNAGLHGDTELCAGCEDEGTKERGKNTGECTHGDTERYVDCETM